jgi:hypothetical protein
MPNSKKEGNRCKIVPKFQGSRVPGFQGYNDYAIVNSAFGIVEVIFEIKFDIIQTDTLDADD